MIQHYIYANVCDSDGSIEIAASTVDGKTQVPLAEVKHAAAEYSLIEMRLNRLAGEILTIVDATIVSKTQNKAVKDLIRQKFSEEFGFFSELLIKGIIDETLTHIENMSDAEWDEHMKQNPPVGLDEIIAPGK